MIKRKNGKIVIIEDVLYVPEMKSNLLSIGQLIEKVYEVAIKKKYFELFDSKEKLILKAPLAKNRTFQVKMDPAEEECN